MNKKIIKKRVACIIPPYYRLIESKNNRLTPAMHYVAQILYDRGHDVVLYNGDYADKSVHYSDRISMVSNSWLFEERYKNGCELYDDIIMMLDKFHPDIVFVSAGDVLIPTVETGSTQSCAVVAKLIKEKYNNVVVVGYGHLLKYAKKADTENLDVIITGEAEEYLFDIVEGNLRGCLPDKWVHSLDSLPILTDKFLYHKCEPQDWDYIMSMRGCVKKCTFCYQPIMRHGRLANMSAERLDKEIRYRIQHFGTLGFYLVDAIFNPVYNSVAENKSEILTQIKKEYPKFSWWAESRVDTIKSKEMYEKMKASGCIHLKFGVEMSNQQMLDHLKKDITLSQIQTAFQLTAEVGIERTAYILLGCPGFDDKDYREMYLLIKNLHADNYVINIMVPYVGTELYGELVESLKDFGIFNDGEESFIHTSTVMQKYWNISDDTVRMYFELQGKKDDSNYREYSRKIVDKQYYHNNHKIKYI